MRSLNVRLLGILLGVVLVLGVVVHVVHGYQVRRNAGVFLVQAQKAKAQKRVKEAINNYGWYTRLVPRDTDALEEFGFYMAENGRDPKSLFMAYGLLEQTLRQDAERKKARRKLVDVAISIGRFSDARVHLEEYLLKDTSDDGELLQLLGRCQAASGQTEQAVQSLQRAIERSPDRLESYPLLAMLLRQRQEKPKDADAWMEKMVKANPKSAKAHILIGGYLRSTGAIDEAQKHAAEALKLSPDDREALWLAAQCALAKDRYDDARKFTQRGVDMYKDSPAMYTTMADIEVRDGNREKAIVWLQRGLDATKKDPQLLWAQANLYIEVGKVREARDATEELRTLGYPPPMIGYLIARIEFTQEHWLLARQGFEKIRSGLTDFPHLLKQTDYWIGQCYGESGNFDRQREAYHRSLAVDPFFGPARAALAEALLANGQLDDALGEYQKVIKMGKAAGGGWLPLARILVLRNLRLPPVARDWDEAEKALQRAKDTNPDSPQVPILRAEVYVAQNRPELAEDLLISARDQYPEKLELWTALASLAERNDAWDRAKKYLDEAEVKLGDQVLIRLARAQYFVRRYKNDAAKPLRELADKSDNFNEPLRLQLWNGLVTATMQVGDDEQVRKLGLRIAEKETNNLQIRSLLFELALRREDMAEMSRLLDDIERIAGRGATWLYGQAVCLSVQAKAPGDRRLEQALAYLTQAREIRPSWSRAPLLMAGIYDQQGRLDRALEQYLEAIELGERNPPAIRRTVQLLFQRQRFTEADQLLRRLEERQMAFSTELTRVGAEVALRLGEFDRALQMARKSAVEHSTDYHEHLWLGQMLGIIGRRDKAEGHLQQAEQNLADAEKALRRAVELNDKVPETWVGLIQFLGANDEPKKAADTLKLAQQKVPSEKAHLAMAQCFEAVGQTEKAKEKYEEALSSAPDDPTVARYLADFYIRTSKSPLAEAQLRRIVDGKVKADEGDVIWARRNLALQSALHADFQNLEKAIGLVKKNLEAASYSTQDKRVLAGLQIAHPKREVRLEAVNILEGLNRDRSTARGDDLLILIKLYMAENMWPKASAEFRSLLSTYPDNPRYVAEYVAALFDHKEIAEAEPWVTRLATLAPRQFDTANLKAQMCFHRQQYEEALTALTGYLDRTDPQSLDRGAQVRQVAENLEKLSQRLTEANQSTVAARFAREAEMLFRQFTDQHPEERLLLAGFLARQGRIDDALKIIEESWTSNTVALAQVSSALLKDKNISSQQLQQGEKVLEAALERFDRPMPLLLAMADLNTSRERYAKAEAYYREILKKNKNNAVAMNNLAVLLAMQKIKLDEALVLVNKAIEIAGPVASMLDSRASVYLAMNKADDALKDLNEAINDGETPVRLFHKAMALQQVGRNAASVEAMHQALDKKLKPEMLEPLERPTYDELIKKVK